MQLDHRRRLGIEVSLAEARLAAADLDEALAVALEGFGLAASRNLGCDGLRSGNALTVGEDARLGQR